MRKYENFKKALKNLEVCEQYEEPYDVVTQTGLVSLFSICFEQAWKAMKEILESHGFGEGKTGSPKMIIKLAYHAGMIEDEAGWLELLDRRNEVAHTYAVHTYNEEVALEVIERTKERYLLLFQDLADEIEANWR